MLDSSQLTEDLLEKVIAVVKSVATFQMKHFRVMPSGSTDVKALRETVSFVDLESEKMIYEGLTTLLPKAGFYGEETGQSGSKDLMWMVDPLDGTTNFLSGQDHFSISVALVSEGESLLGVVMKPFSDEIYSVIKSHGVCYNGVVSQPNDLDPEVSESLFITGFPYRSPAVAEGFFKTAAEVLVLGQGIRRSGSAALDLAQLSMGWVQGFWETDLQPYDIAASMLMAEEYGAVVTNERGERYDMFNDKLMVVGFPKVHVELLNAVQSGYNVK